MKATLAKVFAASWCAASAVKESRINPSSGGLARGFHNRLPAHNVSNLDESTELTLASAPPRSADAEVSHDSDEGTLLQLNVSLRGGAVRRQQKLPTPFPMKTEKHRKEAGSSYLEGSPLYAKQQQRVDAKTDDSSKPAAPVTEPEPQTVATSSASSLWFPHNSAYRKVSALVLVHIVLALLVVMFAYLYRAHGKSRYLRDTLPYEGDWFTFGLCDCTGLGQDWSICLMAFFCPFIRWADTMTKARLLPFWTGLGLMIVMLLLWPITYGAISLLITMVGVYFRQRLRKLYGHGPFQVMGMFLDCLAWTCCLPCSIAQEAREVERVQREPMAVPQQQVQLQRGHPGGHPSFHAAPPPLGQQAQQRPPQAPGSSVGSSASLRLNMGKVA